MGTFTAQIRQFCQQTEQKQNLIIRKLALLAYTKIQQRTPVDTGQLRLSWTVGINQLPIDYHQNNQNPVKLSQAKFGDTIFIATNKPYARQLEYGLYPTPSKTGKTSNGYSIQAPQGMVRITVNEVRAYVERLRI